MATVGLTMQWILLLSVWNGSAGVHTVTMQEFNSQETCAVAGKRIVAMTMPITEKAVAKFECVKK